MQIKCLHGYFIFTEHEVGEISQLASKFDLDLVFQDGIYTFDTLKDAPKYSIEGGLYLGAAVTKTLEGEPWEIMDENELIYDFLNDAVVSTVTIIQNISLKLVDYYYLSSGLILPGSVTEDGSRITDYSAWFSFEDNTFKYSEVDFE